MATPNTNDNTQLGTGELISNEQIETTANRGDPNQPISAYKVPRSKIAIGAYGQDGGDATRGTPLQVESYLERREIELDTLVMTLGAINNLQNFAAEGRGRTTFDVRGQLLSDRGQR